MLRSVGSNWVLTLATIAVGFILPPLLIGTFGKAVYGEWANVVAVTGYLSLLLAGVPMATVRDFTRHIATGDRERLNKAIASAMGLYVGAGAAAVVVGLILFGAFDRAFAPKIVADCGPVVAGQARAAFLITIFHLAFGFVSQVPAAIMTAHRDFLLRNAITIGGMLLRLGLIVTWVRADATLTTLAIAHVIQMVVESLVMAFVVLRRYPGTRLSLAAFDWSEARALVGFSVYALLLAVGIKLVFQTSAPILRWFTDSSAVTAFEQAKNLALYLGEVVLAIGAVAMPTAIKFRMEGRTRELADMFLQWSKVALSITLVAGLYLVALGEEFLRTWINQPDFDAAGAGSALIVLMASHFVFLPVRGIALPILMGVGQPARPAFAFVATGVLSIVLSVALVEPLGMMGVAWGIGISEALFAAYVLKLACAEAGVSVRRWIGYVWGRAAMGAVPVLALLFVLKKTVTFGGWWPVLLAGVASTALFAFIWVRFVYKGDPYIDATGRLRSLLNLVRRPAS